MMRGCIEDVQIDHCFGAGKIFAYVYRKGCLADRLLRHQCNGVNMIEMANEQSAVTVKRLCNNEDFILSENFLASHNGVQGTKAGVVKGDHTVGHAEKHECFSHFDGLIV